MKYTYAHAHKPNTRTGSDGQRVRLGNIRRPKIMKDKKIIKQKTNTRTGSDGEVCSACEAGKYKATNGSGVDLTHVFLTN
jgi:hypothetical protein